LGDERRVQTEQRGTSKREFCLGKIATGESRADKLCDRSRAMLKSFYELIFRSREGGEGIFSEPEGSFNNNLSAKNLSAAGWEGSGKQTQIQQPRILETSDRLAGGRKFKQEEETKTKGDWVL